MTEWLEAVWLAASTFRRIENVFQVEEGTPQVDGRDVLVMLIEADKIKRYDFGPAGPVVAIK